jgi:hypothetical protein
VVDAGVATLLLKVRSFSNINVLERCAYPFAQLQRRLQCTARLMTIHAMLSRTRIAHTHTAQIIDLESQEDDMDDVQQEISMLQTCKCAQLTHYHGSFMVDRSARESQTYAPPESGGGAG